jgi:hypothetical protein
VLFELKINLRINYENTVNCERSLFEIFDIYKLALNDIITSTPKYLNSQHFFITVNFAF